MWILSTYSARTRSELNPNFDCHRSLLTTPTIIKCGSSEATLIKSILLMGFMSKVGHILHMETAHVSQESQSDALQPCYTVTRAVRIIRPPLM